MEQSRYIVVFITAGNKEEAQKLSQALVEGRLAACVNTIPGVDSHFRWQGKTESASEFLLIAKTKESELNDIITTVKKIHSYSIPEIIALPIIGGSPEYLDWIDRETA